MHLVWAIIFALFLIPQPAKALVFDDLESAQNCVVSGYHRSIYGVIELRRDPPCEADRLRRCQLYFGFPAPTLENPSRCSCTMDVEVSYFTPGSEEDLVSSCGRAGARSGFPDGFGYNVNSNPLHACNPDEVIGYIGRFRRQSACLEETQSFDYCAEREAAVLSLPASAVTGGIAALGSAELLRLATKFPAAFADDLTGAILRVMASSPNEEVRAILASRYGREALRQHIRGLFVSNRSGMMAAIRAGTFSTWAEGRVAGLATAMARPTRVFGRTITFIRSAPALLSEFRMTLTMTNGTNGALWAQRFGAMGVAATGVASAIAVEAAVFMAVGLGFHLGVGEGMGANVCTATDTNAHDDANNCWIRPTRRETHNIRDFANMDDASLRTLFRAHPKICMVAKNQFRDLIDPLIEIDKSSCSSQNPIRFSVRRYTSHSRLNSVSSMDYTVSAAINPDRCRGDERPTGSNRVRSDCEITVTNPEGARRTEPVWLSLDQDGSIRTEAPA